jgi:hypothetical protein
MAICLVTGIPSFTVPMLLTSKACSLHMSRTSRCEASPIWPTAQRRTSRSRILDRQRSRAGGVEATASRATLASDGR